MLQPNPFKRPTAAQVLAHTWFENRKNLPDNKLTTQNPSTVKVRGIQSSVSTDLDS